MTTVNRETKIALSEGAISYDAHTFDKTADGSMHKLAEMAAKGSLIFSEHKDEFTSLAQSGQRNRTLRVNSDGRLASLWTVAMLKTNMPVAFQAHDGSYLDPSKLTDAFNPAELTQFVTDLLPLYDTEVTKLMAALESHKQATPNAGLLKASIEGKSLRGTLAALYDLSKFTPEELATVELADLHFDYLHNALILGDKGGTYELPADILAKVKGRMPVADWSKDLVVGADSDADDVKTHLTGAVQFSTAQNLVFALRSPSSNENAEMVDEIGKSVYPKGFTAQDILSDTKLILEDLRLHGVDDGAEYRPGNAKNNGTTISAVSLNDNGKYVDQDGKTIKVGPIVVPEGAPAGLKATFEGMTLKPKMKDGVPNDDALTFGNYLHALNAFHSAANKEIVADTSPMTPPLPARTAAGLFPADVTARVDSDLANGDDYAGADAAHLGQVYAKFDPKTGGVSIFSDEAGTTPVKLKKDGDKALSFKTLEAYQVWAGNVADDVKAIIIRERISILFAQAAITFDSPSSSKHKTGSEITKAGAKILDNLVKLISDNKTVLGDTVITIRGYASYDQFDWNGTLANERAVSVEKYLTDKLAGNKPETLEFATYQYAAADITPEAASKKTAPYYYQDDTTLKFTEFKAYSKAQYEAMSGPIPVSTAAVGTTTPTVAAAVADAAVSAVVVPDAAAAAAAKKAAADKAAKKVAAEKAAAKKAADEAAAKKAADEAAASGTGDFG
jgi:hypothetical protein